MEIPADEGGALRSSDVDLLHLKAEHVTHMLRQYITLLSDEDWEDLERYDVKDHVKNLLQVMCTDVVVFISQHVYRTLRPRVSGVIRGLRDATEPPQRSRDPERVTEADIRHSLGGLLGCSFGSLMELKQSIYFGKLDDLFVMEITSTVNHYLTAQRLSIPPEQLKPSAESIKTSKLYVKAMAFCLGNMLHRSVKEAKNHETRSDYEDPEASGSEVEDDQEDGEGLRQTSVHGTEGGVSVQSPAGPADEPQQQIQTFLNVFLAGLLDHIALSTKTSIYDVDFGWMLERLRNATEISSALPQTVGSLHIHVYRKLCREFGSKKLLQAAMVSNDAAFDEAVARILKAELQKSSRKNISFLTQVRRLFCRRTRKVCAAGGTNTSEPHSEDLEKEARLSFCSEDAVHT